MRYHVVSRTLCFILNGDDVLLIKWSLHKRLFPGKINGLGGHVENDEDVETAVDGLAWVGGKPNLLWQALDAREKKRPFFTHRTAVN